MPPHFAIDDARVAADAQVLAKHNLDAGLQLKMLLGPAGRVGKLVRVRKAERL